jgi:rhamnogalacturonan endolyase
LLQLRSNPLVKASANTGGVGATDTKGGIVGSNTLYGNGNHNLSIAAVDGDGCDEILWGAAALNNDGTLLYATGYGHGDAIHVGKMIPDSTDLYVFDVHEEKLTSDHGSWDLHNARTGRVIWHGDLAEKDNGRGMAAALSSTLRGYQFWSSDNRYPRSAADGTEVIKKSCSVNYRIYWDGSYVDQLFDGNYNKNTGKAAPYIQKWNGSSFTNALDFNSSTYKNPQSCNGTKATPCLQADILGDWREELIMWNYDDPSEIMIYSTWTPTEYTVPTLMHDHVYRMGVCWQNTAYNQPPHLGYYLPDYIDGKLPSSIGNITTVQQETEQVFDAQGRQLNSLHKGLNIVRKNGRVKKVLVL